MSVGWIPMDLRRASADTILQHPVLGRVDELSLGDETAGRPCEFIARLSETDWPRRLEAVSFSGFWRPPNEVEKVIVAAECRAGRTRVVVEGKVGGRKGMAFRRVM